MTAVLVADGPDRGLVWHYGDPLGEQRWMADGTGVVDLSSRTVAPDRVVVWSAFAQPYPGRHGTPDCLGGYELWVPRAEVPVALARGRAAGLWAYTARRIAAGVPRPGVDDPPGPGARLVRLHLDGSDERTLTGPMPLTRAGVAVGVLTSAAYHYELGPIGLGYVDRGVADETTLLADGVPALVERLGWRDLSTGWSPDRRAGE